MYIIIIIIVPAFRRCQERGVWAALGHKGTLSTRATSTALPFLIITSNRHGMMKNMCALRLTPAMCQVCVFCYT